ncbi:MAG: family 10 glycosylhydrolase [Bryobacteraceae bacterium]
MREKAIGILLMWGSLLLTGNLPAETKRRIVFNDDAQSLMEAPAEGTERFIRDFIHREVARTPITTFVYLAATPDICLYDSKVGEVYGDRLGKAFDQKYAPGIRAFRAQGTDVLKVVTSEIRARGMEMLAAVRMGDTHHMAIAETVPLCPRFAIQHPEYVIRQPDGRTNETALDYSHPEVRSHRLAVMRELAENYDIDGLELDFCRWAKFFPRDQGLEKAPIMTEFVGQVRRMLNETAAKRGRKKAVLGVRVPDTIRTCWLAGLDPETWVRNGWIDYLTISTWNEADPQIKADEFARFTKGRTQLLVSMGNMMGGYWNGLPKIVDRGSAQFHPNYYGMLLTADEARAFAYNYYAWGADGIHFWNISCEMGDKGGFTGPAQRERTYAWMNVVTSPGKVLEGVRRYHYLPLHKWAKRRAPPERNYPWYGIRQSPLGTVRTQILEFSEAGVRRTYQFRMADGRNGEKLNGTLRFPIYFIDPEDRIEIDVNGRPVPYSKVRRIACDREKIGLPGAWFEVALADCPPFRGDNELGIILHTERKREPVPYMEELDITVR